MTEVSLHSLLVVSLLGPLLDTCSSEKIHVALLRFFVRFPIREVLPRWWEISYTQLDVSFKQLYENMMSVGVKM